MRLAIIIPALNEADSIAATLAPLQAMRSRGVEVVVVDGGSEDATVAVASRVADRVVVSGRGRAAQMNAGVHGVGADVLLFLHADSLLPPDADYAILNGLAASPRVWGRFDVNISGQHWLLPIIAAMMNFRSRLSGIATGDQRVSNAGWFRKHSLDGRYCDLHPVKKTLPPDLPQPTHHHLRPPLGKTRCVAHRHAHVAYSARVFFWGRPGGTAPCLLLAEVTVGLTQARENLEDIRPCLF
jgi:glycosyltransferase involved in cell wall biosynthesis